MHLSIPLTIVQLSIFLLVNAKQCQCEEKNATLKAFSDSLCGTLKKCLLSPNCEKQKSPNPRKANLANGKMEPSACDTAVSYTRSSAKQGWVDFELLGQLQNIPSNANAQFLAIGFSDDKTMGDESVTECVFNGAGKPTIYHSRNDGKTNRRDKNSNSEQMMNETTEIIEGGAVGKQIVCRFRQIIIPPDEYRSQLPLLNVSYHLLLASGFVDKDDRMLPHTTNKSSPFYPIVATKKVVVAAPARSLLNLTTTTETTTTVATTKGKTTAGSNRSELALLWVVMILQFGIWSI